MASLELRFSVTDTFLAGASTCILGYSLTNPDFVSRIRTQDSGFRRGRHCLKIPEIWSQESGEVDFVSPGFLLLPLPLLSPTHRLPLWLPAVLGGFRRDRWNMNVRDLPHLGNTKEQKLWADGYAFSSDSLYCEKHKRRST